MNKLRRIIFALFITLSLILGLSACRNKVKVEFDQASYTIKEGFEQKVPMHLTGVKFDNKDLVVESSNPNVFTVVLIDGFAEVTAVAPGTATLKILYKQKELASVEIKVIAREDLRVESLSIDLDTELNIEVGISEDVPIILTNIVYNDPDLTIISSNQLVATAVIKEGFITVTGVAVGTATLTLKKGEAVDTLVVNVSEGEVVIPDDETLVTFIVEVPMDTIGEVYVVTNLNDFDVEDGILLTKNADGKYEGSKSMKIGHELKYKYVNGKSWDYVEKLADGSEMEDNRTVTITDGMAPITDTVALWAGDIPPVQNVNVTFSVEVPADTKHVYIVGSFNNWNEIDPIEMAKDIETGKFTVVIELEVGQEVKYKYLNGKDWEHVEKGADGEEIGNRLLTPDAETTTVNDIVATWNLPDIVLGDPVTFKIIVTVPETTGDNEVHLISNLDEWSATKAHLLTKNEVTGKYEIELTHPENTVFKFKFVLNASWDRVEVDANGNDITDRQLVVVADMQPTECEVLRWKEIVDPTTKVTVRIEVAVPAETPADADVYLISDLDEWKEANAHKLTPLENGNFEIELSLVENSVFKFKFVLNGLWANVEQDANGEDIDDRSFTVTADLVLEPFAVARWKGIEVPAADVSVKFEVSVPAETPADASVYLIGSMINWVFADAYLLNKNGETGKYEVTLTLKDGTTYEYKYVIGKTDYSNVELQANGKDVQNRTLAVTEATTLVENTVARWKGIDPITEPTKVTVKIEVAVPAETPADANIYLISDLDEWQEANAHKLTPLENGNFEIELSLVENSVFKFKFVLNGLWANVEQDANGKDIDNRLFTVTADLVLEPFAVARWKGIEPPAVDVSVKFSVSVPAETPADANVYLVGSMVDWVLTDAHLLTKNGETGKYEVTLTLKDGTTYEYKYVIGNTDYSNVELQANGEDVQNRSLAVIEATTLVENTVARWKGIEPPAADVSVKFEVSVPAETPVDASVYLVGSMVEWMLADAHLLTKNGETGKYEITLTLKDGTTYTYKYVIGNTSYDNEEVDINGLGIDNRELAVTETTTLVENIVARWKGIEIPVEEQEVTFLLTVPVETIAPVCLVHDYDGNFDLTKAWTLNSKGENLFELKVTLPVGTVLKYKYTLNFAWTNVEMQADGITDVANREITVTKGMTAVENTVARWKGIEPPAVDVSVKFSVSVPAETPAEANVYLVGSMVEWVLADAHLLTKNGETGKYEITLTLKDGTTYTYKYIIGNTSYDNEEVDINGIGIENRSLAVTEATTLIENTVARWKGIEPPAADVSVKFSVEVPFETPADANVYLVGSMVEWVLADAHLLTKNGETGKYEVTLTLKDGTTYEYKYVIGNANYDNEEVQANGAAITNRSLAVTTEITLSNDVVARWKGVEAPNVQVKFIATLPAETPADATIYLVGSMVNWELGDAYALIKNGETGNYEVTLTLKGYESYEYKYIIGNSSYDFEEYTAEGTPIVNRKVTVAYGMPAVVNTVARWKGIEPGAADVQVKFIATVPAETPADASVYLVGSMCDWKLEKAHLLVKNGETGKYEVTITLKAGTTYEYKYIVGNTSYDHEEVQASGEGIANREVMAAAEMLPVENTVARWKGIEVPATDVSVKFEVTVPVETPADANVYLVGSMVEWQLADAHLLTKNGETGKYEVTLTLKDGTTYTYKYIIGNTSYDNEEVDINGVGIENRSLAVTEATTLVENTVARWKGIEPPAVDVSVKFSVEVPFETPADANVYLVGSMVEWVLADAHLLTKNGETGKYEVTLTLKDGTTYEYKYVIGNTNYDNEEVQANGAAITNRSLAVTTEITLSNDVVARWKGVEAPNVQVKFIATLPAETPADATIYLVGSMVNWQLGDAYALTKNGETGNYEVTLTLKGYETYEYKYIIGNSSYDFEEYTAEGTPIVNRKVTVAYGMPAVANTVARWKGIEPGAADVQVKFIATVPAETPADASVYLVGSMCDWKLEKAHLLAKNGETGKYEVTITLKAGTTYEYKYIVGNTSYDHEEVQASGEGIANREVMAIAEMLPVENTVARWKGIAVPPVNMVQNPNFASGMDNWATFTGAGAANYTPDGENGLKVEVITVGASYEPRLSQMGIAFEKGKSYRISFDAKALAEKTINLQVGQLIDFDPYFINFINGWIVHREVGLEWNTLTFEFTMNHENPNGGIVLEFGTVGESAVTTTLWIRNVEVVEIDLLPVVKETVKFEVTVPDYTTGEVALVHNLIGWDALNGLVLTKNSETGKYEGQMDIQVGMTLEYKYVLNKSWDNVEVQSDGVTDIPNRVLNITSGMVKTLDTVQRWKGIEPPAPKVTTHFVLTVPTGTPADAVIYIIGELPGLENVYPEPPTQPTHAWGNFTDDYKLVKGEDGKYRISIESEPNFYLRYNYYIVMGDKNIREIGALRTHTAVATNTLNDEVTKWEEPVTITFSVTVPEGTPADASVYVIGVFKELIYPGMGVNPTQLNHQWNNFTNKYKMIKGEGSVYTLSLVIDYNYTFFYKYVYTVDNIDRFWETGDDRSRTATETITLNDTVSAWNPAPAKYTVTFSVTVPAVPEGANVYMIGVFPGLLWLGDLGEGEDPTVNHQWNNFSNTYKMTKGEGNVYTLNVEAPVNFTLIYKYAILTSSNDRVWEVHDNREYVVTAAGTQNDVVNSWEEIPTTDKMVLISVAAPAGTENVYFVGNVTEPAWDVSNPVPLTYNSVSGKFEIEAPFSVGYVLEYKFVCGPHWAFVEVDGSGEDIGNRQTTIQEETTSIEVTVAGWKNVYDPDGANVVVKFIVTVPAGTTGDVYLVGINGWDLADGIKLTKNNETGKYEGNVTLQSGHVYEYKFVNGTTWETGANRVLVPTSDQTEQADTVTAWSS